MEELEGKAAGPAGSGRRSKDNKVIQKTEWCFTAAKYILQKIRMGSSFDHI